LYQIPVSPTYKIDHLINHTSHSGESIKVYTIYRVLGLESGLVKIYIYIYPMA